MANTDTPMTFKKISIKSFISDLPNVFNENFSKIADFINSIYDFAKKKLQNISEIEVSGTVTANTVKAKNLLINGGITSDKLVIKVKDDDGTVTTINILELQRRVERLENPEL